MELYTYKARVTNVYDGDTITADIDLGFGITAKKQRIQLAGINAPELRGPSEELGVAAKERLKTLVLDRDDVIIKTSKDNKEKYGKYFATIYVTRPFGDINVNEQLVNEGLATKL